MFKVNNKEIRTRHQCSVSITPENVRKPKFIRTCFILTDDTMTNNAHCIVYYRDNILKKDSSFYKFLLHISSPVKRSENVRLSCFQG